VITHTNTNQTRGHRLLASSLGLICVLGMLVACGGTNNTQTKKNQPNILTVGVSPTGNFVENYNPLIPSSDLYGTLGLLYETLTFFNRMGGTQTPMLASSYEMNSAATSVTFHLRPNVFWSDGQPFTSADVKFTLELLQKYPALDTNGLWQTISDVSAPDNTTVIVNLKHSAQPFIWYLAGQTYIVPQHIWSTISDPTKYTDTNPIGTGPVTLKSFTPALYKYQKNPKYWNVSQMQVDEIDYPAFNSNTTGELLLSNGSLDWNGVFEANIEKVYVNRDKAHNHYWFPGAQTTMLYVNLTKFPFSDLGVRKAIAETIDRGQIQTLAESGYQIPASPTGLVLPANKSFLSTQYSSLAFSVNTSQAAQDLQSAGYAKDSSGIWAKNGQEINFTVQAPTGWSDWDTVCQIISSELGALGMKVTVLSPSVADYVSALQNGTFDASVSWTSTGPTPYYLYNSLLNSIYTAAAGKAATSNYDRWQDATTDKLLNDYASTTDSNQQMQDIYGLEQIMVEQLPSIPLVYGSNWYEYSTARFTGWPDASNAYALPGPFNYPDDEQVILHLKPVS
jgi:peptide/nickel transport system substrate-binding protein